MTYRHLTDDELFRAVDTHATHPLVRELLERWDRARIDAASAYDERLVYLENEGIHNAGDLHARFNPRKSETVFDA